MGNFLDAPIIEKVSDSLVSSTGLLIGGTGMQGWRLEMEDEHILTDMPSLRNHTFLAVFDGHGGAGSAAFAKRHLVETIESTSEWKKYVDTRDIKYLGDALIQAFLNLDVDLRAYQDQSNDSSGCTSVTAMITPDYIVCANAGDSRCILATNNSVKKLSDDHKPYDEVERNRIENAGGKVHYDRVDGDLAVSRAFGDFQWKARTDLSASEQKVTCYPDITVHERTDTDEVLILACDGVWDVFTNEEAANLVYEILESGESSMVLLAEEIADIALGKGSRDNISVVAVKLPGARKAPVDLGGVKRRRQERDLRRYEYEGNQMVTSPSGFNATDEDNQRFDK